MSCRKQGRVVPEARTRPTPEHVGASHGAARTSIRPRLPAESTLADARVMQLRRAAQSGECSRWPGAPPAGARAPNARLRSSVVPAPPSSLLSTSTDDAACPALPSSRRRPRRPIPWAELLRRTFGADVLNCQSCDSHRRVVAVVLRYSTARALLEHLTLPWEQGEGRWRPTRSPNSLWETPEGVRHSVAPTSRSQVCWRR